MLSQNFPGARADVDGLALQPNTRGGTVGDFLVEVVVGHAFHDFGAQGLWGEFAIHSVWFSASPARGGSRPSGNCASRRDGRINSGEINRGDVYHRVSPCSFDIPQVSGFALYFDENARDFGVFGFDFYFQRADAFFDIGG